MCLGRFTRDGPCRTPVVISLWFGLSYSVVCFSCFRNLITNVAFLPALSSTLLTDSVFHTAAIWDSDECCLVAVSVTMEVVNLTKKRLGGASLIYPPGGWSQQ